MAQKEISGPIDVYTGNASVFAGGAFPQNPFGAITGANPVSDDPYVGFFPMVLTVDQVPSAISAASLCTSQNATSGTAFKVTPGGSITLSGGQYYMDGVTATNPTTSVGVILSRAVSVTGVSNAAGGSFLVTGQDFYGNTQTQTLTVQALTSPGTTNTTKTFKSITSVVPQFTDAHAYTIGVADIYGFPILSTRFQDIFVYWNSTLISANTGYVAADTTNPATALTGDVRGTYATQSASDGTKRLTLLQCFRGYTAPSMLGVTPA